MIISVLLHHSKPLKPGVLESVDSIELSVTQHDVKFRPYDVMAVVNRKCFELYVSEAGIRYMRQIELRHCCIKLLAALTANYAGENLL